MDGSSHAHLGQIAARVPLFVHAGAGAPARDECRRLFAQSIHIP
jgi:hypothetical protein